MKKIVISKKFIIWVLLIIVIIIAVPSSVYGYNNYNYKKFYNNGIELLNKEKFDEAINAFNSSLKFKPKQKELVESKVTLVKMLKESKAVFSLGINQENEKKYLDAIETFKKIKNEDSERYAEAQNKIIQCKESYIKENLDNAKNEASNKKYAEAIVYLDAILKFDDGNKDAQVLKDEYNNNIKQIAAAAEKAKKEEAERIAAQKSAKATSTTASTKKTTSSSTSTPKTTNATNEVRSNNNLFIVLNGGDPLLGRMLSLREAAIDPQPFGLVFDVCEGGFGHPVDYDITFYLVGRTVKYSGKTSTNHVRINVSRDEVPQRENIKIIIDFKVDGKVYTTSGYRVLNPGY